MGHAWQGCVGTQDLKGSWHLHGCERVASWRQQPWETFWVAYLLSYFSLQLLEGPQVGPGLSAKQHLKINGPQQGCCRAGMPNIWLEGLQQQHRVWVFPG